MVLQDLQGRYRQAKSETGSETGRNGFQDDWSNLQWIFQFIQHCGTNNNNNISNDDDDTIILHYLLYYFIYCIKLFYHSRIACISFISVIFHSFSLILSSSGDFLLRVSVFNSSVCNQVLSLSDAYTNPASSQNPFNVFDYLSIYHPEEHTAVIGLLGAIEKS